MDAVASFHVSLLANMKHTPTNLVDAVRARFNVSAMAAIIAGPPWSTASDSDRIRITSALTRYLAARFAHEFDTYDGEQFRTDPMVQSRGPDQIVRTEVVQHGAAPIHLDYRLRAYEGQWLIIDVYYDGVSQLATERADVATAAPQPLVLAAHFEAAAAALNR
jgi:phospholipid transport system substrate-binding protein